MERANQSLHLLTLSTSSTLFFRNGFQLMGWAENGVVEANTLADLFVLRYKFFTFDIMCRLKKRWHNPFSQKKMPYGSTFMRISSLELQGEHWLALEFQHNKALIDGFDRSGGSWRGVRLFWNFSGLNGWRWADTQHVASAKAFK
jgi:hypothetical protein